MSILTVEPFILRIGETEADNVAGFGPRGERDLDLDKIAGALSFADALIEGKLRSRFPEIATLDPMPELLLGIAQDIAIYRLRHKVGDQSGVQDETVKRYQAALKLLDQIAEGDLQLGIEEEGQDQQPVLVSGEPSRANRILDGW